MPCGINETVKKWWAILPCFKFETTTYESCFGGFCWQKTRFIGSKIAEKIFNLFFSMFSIKKPHIIEG